MLKRKKDHLWLVFGWIVVLAVIVFSLMSNNLLKKPTDPQPTAQIPPTTQQQQNQITQTPSPSTAPTLPPKLLNLRLFFVAIGDNGQKGEMVGCGDSIAPVDIQLPETEAPLQAVMQQLLSTKQQAVGPSKLYNSLSQSKLEFKDASIKNGVATIHLIGSVQLGGECDNPRFQSQLEKTAKQFSNVNEAQIFINDKPLSDVISLK